jgi:hypothetical protein
VPTYLAAAEVRQMLSTIDDLTKQARQIEEGIEHVRAISRPSQVKSPTAWNYLWARKETVAWAKAAQRAKEAARKAESPRENTSRSTNQ